MIQETINLFTIENVRISVISKNFEKDCTLTEPIYGTKYSVAPFDEKLKNLLTHPKVDEVHDLIKENTFLPKNLELFAKEFDNLPEYPY